MQVDSLLLEKLQLLRQQNTPGIRSNLLINILDVFVGRHQLITHLIHHVQECVQKCFLLFLLVVVVQPV